MSYKTWETEEARGLLEKCGVGVDKTNGRKGSVVWGVIVGYGDFVPMSTAEAQNLIQGAVAAYLREKGLQVVDNYIIGATRKQCRFRVFLDNGRGTLEGYDDYDTALLEGLKATSKP